MYNVLFLLHCYTHICILFCLVSTLYYLHFKGTSILKTIEFISAGKTSQTNPNERQLLPPTSARSIKIETKCNNLTCEFRICKAFKIRRLRSPSLRKTILCGLSATFSTCHKPLIHKPRAYSCVRNGTGVSQRAPRWLWTSCPGKHTSASNERHYSALMLIQTHPETNNRSPHFCLTIKGERHTFVCTRTHARSAVSPFCREFGRVIHVMWPATGQWEHSDIDRLVGQSRPRLKEREKKRERSWRGRYGNRDNCCNVRIIVCSHLCMNYTKGLCSLTSCSVWISSHCLCPKSACWLSAAFSVVTDSATDTTMKCVCVCSCVSASVWVSVWTRAGWLGFIDNSVSICNFCHRRDTHFHTCQNHLTCFPY